MAAKHTADQLSNLMSGEEPHLKSRGGVLHFTPEQYEVFENAVMANGGVKSGRGLSGKEKALVKTLAK